jgi:hypothetical protein
VCIWDNKAAILYDKNTVAVFELTTRTVVFQATYAEASDNISRILFICDSATNPRSEHSELLNGYLLLAETKIQPKKDAPTPTRKLHLVEMQQTEVKLKKGSEKKDKLEKIDTLAFGEEIEKMLTLIAMDDHFFVFMLNRDSVSKYKRFNDHL